ncbi:mediator of RNA polymerase II transcription subunit 31 [Micractinium conductrix]|uniref:Mediator of RNA polymerase II transcription subunit 31 n=1 Tax=Micractinium conductrix TaxID=554055 RepID=A0A2P6V5B4_9CHLO|nr:mediator of RNA polymerase II transcription subunit 31 [Micractinium conductrix]|eukprot:PSC69273.1 mediator of RNA polymerase II transcription subunit 31 [Micractinium conductrix]
MSSNEPRRAGPAEVGCDDRRRFELELEFLHCLANPGYLNWLAQNRYLDDPAFLSYLQYLQYWLQPAYARFVVYPHALYFLDLLQTPEFRAKIANPAYKETVHTQQFFYWQFARANRLCEKAAAGGGGTGGGGGGPAAAGGGAAAMEVDAVGQQPATG